MQPTPGRFVDYTLTEQDAAIISSDRASRFAMNQAPHRHNPVSPGDTYPALVVKAFGGGAANLQVFLDGTDTYWATSRTEGEPGKWGHWAPPSEA